MTIMRHSTSKPGFTAPAKSACLEQIGSGRQIEWRGSQAEPKAYRLDNRQVGSSPLNA